MCYDAETSLKTFMISAPVSLYLALRGSSVNLRIYGWLFFYVAFMQLIEFVLWKNQQYGSKTNSVVSKIIDPYLIGQPLVALLAIHFLDKTNVNHLLLFNILVFIFISFHNIFDKKPRHSRPGDNGNLNWDTVTKIKDGGHVFLGVLLFVAVVLVSKIDKSTVVVAILGLLSLTYHMSKTQQWGSGWCNTVNMIPVALMGVNFLPGA